MLSLQDRAESLGYPGVAGDCHCLLDGEGVVDLQCPVNQLQEGCFDADGELDLVVMDSGAASLGSQSWHTYTLLDEVR